MNGISGHNSALQAYTGPCITWANEMNFCANHAPGAGAITRPTDLQSSVSPTHHNYPLYHTIYTNKPTAHFFLQMLPLEMIHQPQRPSPHTTIAWSTHVILFPP